MDELAKLSIDARSELFFEASRRLGLEPSIVEKDFWVCWILQKLLMVCFSLTGLLSHFVKYQLIFS